MKEHSKIVREYVELRNYLGKSNPRANMEFEIYFKIERRYLLAFNSISKVAVELAKLRPRNYRGVFLPDRGVMFEAYSASLINYINKNLMTEASASTEDAVLRLALAHKKSLNLNMSYEPKN